MLMLEEYEAKIVLQLIVFAWENGAVRNEAGAAGLAKLRMKIEAAARTISVEGNGSAPAVVEKLRE